MSDARLYQFAVILQAKTTGKDEAKESAKLIVEPTTILATDPEKATLLAGRAIPEEYLDRLDRLTIAVRPF